MHGTGNAPVDGFPIIIVLLGTSWVKLPVLSSVNADEFIDRGGSFVAFGKPS